MSIPGGNATTLFLCGFIAVPWPAAGSVLFTFGAQRALDEIRVAAGVLVMILFCRALAGTSSPIRYLASGRQR